MTNRKLCLKKDALSALTSDDLHAVVGASGATCFEPRCFIDFAPSMPPTCQNSLCFCTTD